MITITCFDGLREYPVSLSNSYIEEVQTVSNHKYFPEVKSRVLFDHHHRWFYSRETVGEILAKLKREG